MGISQHLLFNLFRAYLKFFSIIFSTIIIIVVIIINIITFFLFYVSILLATLQILLQILSCINHGSNPCQLDCISFLTLHQVLEKLSNTIILLYKFPKYLFDNTQYFTIGKGHLSRGGINMGNALLLNSNILGIDESVTRKEKVNQ